LFRKLVAAGSFISFLMAPGFAAGAGTTLRQTVMAELRYDTNARIAAEGELSGDDFVLLLAPGFEVINQRNKLTLTGNYRPTGSYYFENQDLNAVSHSAAVSADYTLSRRTSLMAEDRFTYSGESLETTLVGIQNQRGTMWTNTIFFSMNHILTQRTSISMSASDHMLDFENILAVDNRSESGSVGLNFQATPETQLNGSYNFSYVNFDLPGGAASNQNTHSLNAGFVSRFRDSLLLSMSAGTVYADSRGFGNGLTDWVARAEIRKSFQRSSANFSYTRQTTSSSGLTDQLTLNDSFIAELRYVVAQNMNLSLSGNYTHNHSKPENTLDIKSFLVGASGTWQLYDWLSFGMGYSHFKQEANGPLGVDLERDHVSISINLTTFEGRL